MVSQDFFHTHSMPPLRRSVLEYCVTCGMEKLEWWGYQMLKKFEDIFIILIQYTNVRDGHHMRASPMLCSVVRQNALKNNYLSLIPTALAVLHQTNILFCQYSWWISWSSVTYEMFWYCGFSYHCNCVYIGFTCQLSNCLSFFHL